MQGDSTVAAGWTFLATDEAGRCAADHHGLYHRGTRHLDRYEMAVGGREAEPLAHIAPRPGERVRYGLLSGDPPVVVRRTRFLTGGGRAVSPPGLYERVELRNEGSTPLSTTVRLAAGTGFDDVREVRGDGVSGRTRSIGITPGDGVAFSYDPDDADVHVRTGVAIDAASQVDVHGGVGRADAVLGTDLRVPPGGTRTVHVAAVAGEPLRDVAGGFATVRDRVRRRARDWRAGLTPVEASGPREDVVHRSVEDLLSLRIDADPGPILVGGHPWNGAPSGRDALLAAYMALPLTTDLAEGTLRYLAARQAVADDPAGAAEPGAIPDELRQGERAVRGEIRRTSFHGAGEATPLFVVLLHETWRWTGDDALVADLWPALERAVAWLEASGEGFLTTSAVGEGVADPGRPDDTGVVHPDGRTPEGPLALAAHQGYACDAMWRAADLYRSVRDDPDRARALGRQADVLAGAFETAFWLDDESCYAPAVDGDGDPVRAVTAAAGHCLWSGVVPDERANAVVDRLLADDCFSGRGVRSLSAAHEAYDPECAHRGSVRPHDSALIALGTARYGRPDAAERIAEGLFGAAVTREDRLPARFAGYGRAERDAVVALPDVCEPQALAAAAPIACLRAVDGLGPGLDP